MNTPPNTRSPNSRSSAAVPGSPFAWHSDAPKNDGDFFFSGDTPNRQRVVAIVGVVTIDGERLAYLYIPPCWRDIEAERGTLHYGPLARWIGKWSGPEHGLCCFEATVLGESSALAEDLAGIVARQRASIIELSTALRDAISTYGPEDRILVTAERQEAWQAVLAREGEPSP